MLKTLSDFRDYYRVIIGLNENEVRDLGKKMMTNNFKDITNIGKHLINSGFVDEVVLHPVAEAYLVKKSNKVKVRVPKVEAPVLTVGGGDNFNAGFIWGILNNLTDQESLVLGTVNARLFVEKGSSPSIDDLYNYISKNKDSIEVINI